MGEFWPEKFAATSASRKILPSRAKERLNNLIKYAMSVSLSEQHARNILARREIGLSILRNEDGQIYGVYIIDHKNRVVLKASEISKEISANQWENLQNEKWRAIRVSEDSFERSYSCLSRMYAGSFMYNYWENSNLSYRDLKYSRKREMGRRM